jgi:ABC-2 type transport system permease protein
MNIYLHELRFYRKNTLLWIVSICAGTLFLFWMYPAFAGNAAAISEVLRNYPDAIQKAFGLSMDKISTVPGFFSFIVSFLMLCGAVQAITLGISVLTKETTGKTADFLLTKPLTRAHILTAKLFATFTCVAVTSAVFIGAAAAFAAAFSTAAFDYLPFLLMSLAFFFIQVIFLALGLLIGAVVPKIRAVLPVSLSTVFGFFILGMVAAAMDLHDLYYVSPFKYFDTVPILETSAYQVSFVATGAAVAALAVLAAFVVFTRRDVHAV